MGRNDRRSKRVRQKSRKQKQEEKKWWNGVKVNKNRKLAKKRARKLSEREREEDEEGKVRRKKNDRWKGVIKEKVTKKGKGGKEGHYLRPLGKNIAPCRADGGLNRYL